ncbi:DUF5979 domain-containing protein [Agromyces atrinae]|uniref:Uncharacterized protein n=1 Tax=Agromyces atrinae TaxID=592376 RepID=A0A4Q2MCD7_9MICO|nr:DUF5979 domain-containing protein [Agromyces atrinae]NYD68156.1 hypothetical protein [Agromyces atrinae]RXZ87702.1 hypothetical protein ESP50_00390 [Agromyces atrinae]
MIPTDRPRSRTPRFGAGRFAAFLTASALALGGLVVIAPPAAAAGGAISGTVFRDFGSDGRFDSGNPASSGIPNDTGLAGVTVTASTGAGTTIATTTTDADGEYWLDTAAVPDGTPVRVEFTALPDGYFPSFLGDDNGSSVQFVEAGATDVDFGVNAPEDYSQGNAPLVTAIQSAGLRALNPGVPSLTSVPWSVPRNEIGNNRGDYSQRTTLATAPETGSLWGTSFDRVSGDVYAAASLRRHSELGPLGLGGIYRVADALTADGSINASHGAVESWLDVTDLGIDVGSFDESSRGLSQPTQPTRDALAYNAVGTVGLGGIASSVDGRFLYAVNLADRTLVRIDVANPTAETTSVFPLGLEADERPWAVTVHRGSVYVGIVDTAESTAGGLAPTTATRSEGTSMSVRVASEADLSALGDPANTVFEAPLDYQRGAVYTGAAERFRSWHPWTNVWDRGLFEFAGWPGVSWAQPILSDLQFTTDGELILGLQDRFSLQAGNRNWAPTGQATTTFETVSLGDILIASPNGSGSYTLENDGVVDGRSTSTGGANEGPGGREFFDDRNAMADNPSHFEIALGALTTVPGVDEVVATAFDPTFSIRVAGNAWFSTVDGSLTKGFQHTDDGGAPPNLTNGSFQKAGGLGDIESLVNAAPLEIGDRVWFDADQDGVQAADEPAIEGVVVELLRDGEVIGTRTTGPDGTYSFRSTDDDLGGAFTPGGGDYTVRFVQPGEGQLSLSGPNADAFGEIDWVDASFTVPGAGESRATDSNADPATGEYVYTAGGPGENDHTIDAGFIANTEFTITKQIGEDGAEAASGQQFTIVADARDFRGDAIALADSPLSLTGDETSAPITVPVGSRVAVSEPDAASYRSVDIVGPTGVTPDADGFYALLGGGAFAFTVTNTLVEPGTFTVSKVVTGDFDLTDPAFADTEFTVAYSFEGGSESIVLNADNDWSATSIELPFGTEVTVSEATIEGAPVYVGWDQPSWSEGDQADGTAIITIGDGTDLALELTNPANLLVGGFSITKAVTGDGADRVPADTEFDVEYSVDGGTTWVGLDPVVAGGTVAGPDDLPLGTTVLLREADQPAFDDVEWGTPAFSGVGVTPGEAGEPASLVIGETGVVALGLDNPTTPRNGQFTLTKSVTGPGATFLDPATRFAVEYRYGDVVETVDLEPGVPFSSESIPTGTVVTVTEVAPTTGLPDAAEWGVPTLTIDGETAVNGAQFTIGDDTVIEVVVVNPTDVTPSVSIEKGDGADGVIVHDADTVAEGEAYAPGSTRTIVISVVNDGIEPLRDVSLSDVTLAGGAIDDLTWTFPDGSVQSASFADGEWTATWPATFGDDPTLWQPGEVIAGSATLTVGASAGAHQDRASVSAVGGFSGKPVDDADDYNAFTGAIQVIKYDGQKADPVVRDGDAWVIPAKPLADALQDANTTDTAVKYPVDTPQAVRWVVTNTGTTWLTDLSLVDVTGTGPAVGDDWTADLSAFGGPADYSFVDDGPWSGLFPPGASFFAEGTLVLGAEDVHADTVTVVGTVVVPATGDDGLPTDQPQLGEGDEPVRAIVDGEPFTVTDDDPFHAWTGVGPYVDIEKGDGTDGVIVNDADSMTDAVFYAPGEKRDIVFTVTNTGDEELVDVVLTDQTLSGASVSSLVWTFPDGTTAQAVLTDGVLTARWEASFSGTRWAPGAVIQGHATLTVALSDEPHVDRATVSATGAASGKPVGDVDDYNGLTARIQVIKYDGNRPDPAVKDAAGNWIVPTKPLVDPSQDANDRANSVEYTAGEQNHVRWVVTNTGTTWLTELTLTDVTGGGPDVLDWTADLSPFGGPSAYSFVESGTWHGLVPPGASFFAHGTLTLAAGDVHDDTVTVTAVPVVPAVDDEGVPTGQPSVDEDGNPVLVTGPDGEPVTLVDEDPFNAHVLPAPLVSTGFEGAWILLGTFLLAGGAALLMLSLMRRATRRSKR